MGLDQSCFCFFINELVFALKRLNIKVKLFAGDAKMHVRILDDSDVVQLQTALDALSYWAENWQLSISINKCCILNVGKVSHHVDVCLAGISMPVVEHTRDLGIIVTNDLSPSHHIALIVAQAHKRAGAILRAFSSRDICPVSYTHLTLPTIYSV